MSPCSPSTSFIAIFLFPSAAWGDRRRWGGVFHWTAEPGSQCQRRERGQGQPPRRVQAIVSPVPTHGCSLRRVRYLYPPIPQSIPVWAGKVPVDKALGGPCCSIWQRTEFISCIQESFLYLLLPMLRICGGLVFGKLLDSVLRSRAFKFVNRAWNRREKNCLLLFLWKILPDLANLQSIEKS